MKMREEHIALCCHLDPGERSNIVFYIIMFFKIYMRFLTKVELRLYEESLVLGGEDCYDVTFSTIEERFFANN
jgi:hypothetical protein